VTAIKVIIALGWIIGVSWGWWLGGSLVYYWWLGGSLVYYYSIIL